MSRTKIPPVDKVEATLFLTITFDVGNYTREDLVQMATEITDKAREYARVTGEFVLPAAPVSRIDVTTL